MNNVLQALYGSEINFSLSTFWDAGFDWKLGDDMNGFVAEGAAKTLAEAISALANAACRHFPDSVFAKANP